MTLNEIRIIAEICTPFLIFIFGIIIFHKTEQIKSYVNRSSDFSIRVANDFYKCYEEIIDNVEKLMLELTKYVEQKKSDKEFYKEYDLIVNSIKKSELHMSIILKSFPEIKIDNISNNVQNIYREFKCLNEKGTHNINFSKIKNELANFSKNARQIHTELLKNDY